MLLTTLSLWAQDIDETVISADRPGAATGPDVVPFKKVQLETGFQYDYTGEHSILLPTAMLRVGISKFAELRLQYDGTLDSEDGNTWKYSVCPLIIGTKVCVYEGNKYAPKTSLMCNLAIPSTKTLAETMHVAPSLYLLFQNDICDWFNIGYNLGAEWDGVVAQPTTFVAVCLGFGITEKLGAYVESYNYITDYGRNLAGEAFLDFGFNYIVHPRVQLDIYGSFNCQDPKSYGNVGIGVAWLIN